MQDFHVGTLVRVFNESDGVVIKAPPKEGFVTVLYKAPNGMKVRALIPLASVKERDRVPLNP